MNKNMEKKSGPVSDLKMTSKQLQRQCEGVSLKGVTNCSILGDNVPPPAPPKRPKVSLSYEQLHPTTLMILVKDKKTANSRGLQEKYFENPIAIVRGLAEASELDLLLFSTEYLVDANPNHAVEIRRQYFQPANENLDDSGKSVWTCNSEHGQGTTIAKFAMNQLSIYDKLKKEGDGENKEVWNHSDPLGTPNKKEIIRFGTNIDLSNKDKWRCQLHELRKLPEFVKVASPDNMLSHVGHILLGMNTVQLYMKVPGNRTPAHQENNNFCAVNINIGPGDSEWFAVAHPYWGALKGLCDNNGVNFLSDPWWPNLEECATAGIPVHHFYQKPGDLVWVNTGCVHWVQAKGLCNNIAWNVGPFSSRQYQASIERYEWNKLEGFRSIVPMIHLSWNLARNFSTPDIRLFELIKGTLMRTLKQCFKLLEFAKSKKVKVSFENRKRNALPYFCNGCQVEIFNIYFGRRNFAHCIDCARKASPDMKGYTCWEQYNLKELMKVYDQFQLQATPPATSPSQPLAPPPPTA